MFNLLIQWSLKRRVLVLGLAGILIAVSAVRVPQMGLQIFPELNAPTVTIMTEASGYTSEQVERSVTFPIETTLNGLPGLRRLRSSSALGLSIVWAEFDFGSDIHRNRQLISERLSQVAEQLPPNIHPPEMTPIASIDGEIMLLGLTSPGGVKSPMDLRRLAEFDLRPRLLAVSGVAQVNALGGELPEFQINVDPANLVRFGLSLKEVEDAAARSHSVLGAGSISDDFGRELPLQPDAAVTTPEQIG
ncbi:MAG TPA: efflux RND transporter permease subunit, partial [Planctomycetota bacterium]|nr:efflux RND transporter permease subunit [Planctomycetota bacterium]